MFQFLTQYKKMQWVYFAFACILYINTIPNEWAVDDAIVVHGNRYVKRGCSGLDSIFTKGTFYGFYGISNNAVAGDRYRPLTLAFFATAAEAFASPEKDKNGNVAKDQAGFAVKDLSATTNFPAVLHFFNVLFYGLLCMLLYRLLLLLLNPTIDTKQEKPFFIASITTLLFTAHPLHTEAVANVKGLDEILSLLMALSAVYATMKATFFYQNDVKKYLKYIITACVMLVLAMLSKETGIAFMVIIPLTIWFFTQKKWQEIVKISAPLGISVVLFLGMRAFALSGSQAIVDFKSNMLMNDPFIVLNENAKFKPLVEGASIKVLTTPAANTFVKMPYTNQLATNIYTFGVYLKLLVLPYSLTSDYYPRHIAIKSFSDLMVIISLILNVFLLIWATLQIKKRNPLAYGILFYYITFALVSNLLFPIGTNMAERFMFTPLLGFCFCIAFLLHNLKTKIDEKIVFTIVSVVFLVYSGITINRNWDWKDDFTLLSHDIHISKNSGKIKLDIIGVSVIKAVSDELAAIEKIKSLPVEQRIVATKAIRKTRDSLILSVLPYAKDGLEMSPMFGVGWVHVARGYHLISQTESTNINQRFTYLLTALEAYKQAMIYRPANAAKEINNYTSICYTDLGKLYGQSFGDVDKAISLLEDAIKLNTENSEPYFLLGTAYSMKKDYAKSIANTEIALNLNPDDYKIKENLAIAYHNYFIENKQKDFLIKAENLLLSILEKEEKADNTEVTKKENLSKILTLLAQNYALQGNSTKQLEFTNKSKKI
jgi:protein O-mannosyl-transferase